MAIPLKHIETHGVVMMVGKVTPVKWFLRSSDRLDWRLEIGDWRMSWISLGISEDL